MAEPTAKPTVKLLFRSRDIWLSSSALALTGKEPTIERDQDLVIFVHEPSAALNDAITLYLANGPIPIQDFIAAFKKLRTQMYSAKG